MARTSSFALLALSCLLVSATGCVAPSGPGDGKVGDARQPIINGTPDTTHQAVVALLGNSSACSGTIIAVDAAKGEGYVLTAAHCVSDPPQVVRLGTNYVSYDKQYFVTDFAAHPDYDSSALIYDFAMVTFSWSGPTPPVIPAIAAPDGLVSGSNVKFVGYGVTESSDFNTVRYYKDGQLETIKALTVEYDQTPSGNNGGPCNGDSGGPALFVVGGTEYVAAVTSYGDANCSMFGASGRVSAAKAFIDDYIVNGGGGSSGQTCDQCSQQVTSGGGPCASAYNACAQNQDCIDFYDCISACSSDACFQTCINNHPQGSDLYGAMVTCICDSGCPTECAAECGGGQQGCGFTSSDQACATCFENACCSEGQACAAEPACVDCLTGNSDPSCFDSNAKAKAFAGCLEASCATECGIDTGTGGGGTGAGTPGTGGGMGTGAGTPGAGGGGVGGGAGGLDEGGNGSGNDNGNNGQDAACGACRVGARSTSDDPFTAIALGAAVVGLASARRRRRA